MTRTCVNLDCLIRVIRNRMQETNNDEENNVEEEVVTSILQENPNRNYVLLNASLSDETDSMVFNTLLSRPQISRVGLIPPLEAGDAESLLRDAIALMSNLRQVDLALEVTETQAEAIFSTLSKSCTRYQFGVMLGNTNAVIAESLQKSLRDSQTLTSLLLAWAEFGKPQPVSIPESSLWYIFEGVHQCKTLKALEVFRPPPSADKDAVAKLVAHAVVTSSSISRVLFAKKGDDVWDALCHTTAIQEFQVCFRVRTEDDYQKIRLCRNNHWKMLLPQDIPLSLWPHILARTKDWNTMNSHSHKDALFFLVCFSKTFAVVRFESANASRSRKA